MKLLLSILRVVYKTEYEKYKMFHVVLMCILAIISLLFPDYTYVTYQYFKRQATVVQCMVI